MKKNNYFLTIVLFIAACVVAIANGPAPLVTIDTDQIIDGAVTILKTDGVAANDLSNVTPATGRAALGLGTMAVATSTDYVATSALALRLDTGNASFSGDIDVAGDVGAATVNGVAPLTAAEKTQALVGSTTVDFTSANLGAEGVGTIKGNLLVGTHDGSTRYYFNRYSSGAPIALLTSGDSDRDVPSGWQIQCRDAAGATVNVITLYHNKVNVNLVAVPTYADNTAAAAGGLAAGDVYKTSTGVLMIKY